MERKIMQRDKIIHRPLWRMTRRFMLNRIKHVHVARV